MPTTAWQNGPKNSTSITRSITGGHQWITFGIAFKTKWPRWYDPDVYSESGGYRLAQKGLVVRQQICRKLSWVGQSSTEDMQLLPAAYSRHSRCWPTDEPSGTSQSVEQSLFYGSFIATSANILVRTPSILAYYPPEILRKHYFEKVFETVAASVHRWRLPGVQREITSGSSFIMAFHLARKYRGLTP